MFQSSPQKLRNTMRRSTGTYVVLKKFAIGQTLYESKIKPKSSYNFHEHLTNCASMSRLLTFLKSCMIRAMVLPFKRPIKIRNMDWLSSAPMVMHCLRHQQYIRASKEQAQIIYVCEPFPEDIPPTSHAHFFFDDPPVCAILPQHDALLLFAG